MTTETYTTQRLQRLELTIAQQASRIRQLEAALCLAESRLAAADQIHGVPA